METVLIIEDDSLLLRQLKCKLPIMLALLMTMLLLTGCNSALNMRVYEPLANAEHVIIEVVNVNNETCPGNSFKDAVSKFDEYVLGDVQIINAEPVQMDLGKDAALSKKQFDEIISKTRYSGQSMINFIVAPDYEYSDNKGLSTWQKNNESIRNIISINAKKCNETAALTPFVSREEIWKVVILHELCHCLNVPAKKSHVQEGRHCTNPTCVLYRKIDLFSIIAAILHGGPPKGLCKQCQAEIENAHKLANGAFYDDSKIFNRFGQLIELNPGSIDAVATEAFYELVYGNNEKAIKSFDFLLAKRPKYKYPGVNDGTSAFALRAICRHNLKQYDKALEDYQKAIEVMPDDLSVLRAYSRILCSSQEEKLRNGTLAISLAKKACKLENWRNSASLDVLACAYAEVGDFDSAIKYEQQAVALEKTYNEEYSKRLELFKKQTAYRK